MKAAIYRAFEGPIAIEPVPEPTPPARGAVIRVEATGLCRSDWHGWMGHDPDIRLPHVPGHELAGVVEEVGAEVTRWRPGDRVTTPFVCGCGSCPQCASGNQQVCDRQFQPGFTHWGSFAPFVAIDFADVNLVRVPESIAFTTAASLGCRFATAFRAIVDQGMVSGGQWVAVHGCGGVGLSAIMIAHALGARVVAVDIEEAKLRMAESVGAEALVDASRAETVVEAVRDATGGGAHVSVDALGSRVTCANSILGLRKRGRHVQVGLLAGQESDPPLPMGPVVANELEIVGSHGVQAFRYVEMLDMIATGRLQPERLVGRTITLEESVIELPAMNRFAGTGVTVIDRF